MIIQFSVHFFPFFSFSFAYLHSIFPHVSRWCQSLRGRGRQRRRADSRGLCNREVIPCCSRRGGDSVTMSMSRRMIYIARFQVCDKRKAKEVEGVLRWHILYIIMIYNIRLFVCGSRSPGKLHCLATGSPAPPLPSLSLLRTIIKGKQAGSWVGTRLSCLLARRVMLWKLCWINLHFHHCVPPFSLQMSGKRSRSFKCAVHHRDREITSENDFHILFQQPPFFER